MLVELTNAMKILPCCIFLVITRTRIFTLWLFAQKYQVSILLLNGLPLIVQAAFFISSPFLKTPRYAFADNAILADQDIQIHIQISLV